MRAQDFVITDAALESAFPIISPEANSTIVVERTEEEVVHAIAQAVARATGVWHRTLPITPEKVLMGMEEA